MKRRFSKITGSTWLGLTLTLLLASAVETYAQDSTQPPPATPRSESSVAPPTVAPKSALPTQVNDPRAVQQLLAALDFQTKRADEAERARDETAQQREEWKALYFAEKERAELLKGATGDRKEAQEATRLAVGILQTQHEEDKAEINLLRDENDALRRSRLKWGFKGAAIGGGTCAAIALPRIFNF